MPRLLLLLFIALVCCHCLPADAQKLKRADMTQAPKEITQWLDAGDSCLNTTGEGCGTFYLQALSNSRQAAGGFYTGTVFAKLCYYYFAVSATDSVLRYMPEALSITKARGEDFNTGFLLNLAAAAHINIAHHTDSALHYFLEARGYFERIKDTLQLAQNYSNIAGVYVDINDDKTALANYNKAFTLSGHKAAFKLRSIIAANIGECYFRMDMPDSVNKYARICLSLAATHNRLDAMCTGNQLMASLLLSGKQYDSAIGYSRAAIRYGHELADDHFLADAYDVYAQSLMGLGRYRQAYDTVLKSIALNERIQNPKGLTRNYKTAADAAMMLHDYKAAAQLFQKNFLLMDTLLSEKNITAIRDVNARYETEKKERLLAEQALVIQQKNTQFKLAFSIGAMLIAGLLVFLFQYRRIQQAKLNRVEQERENAVLKAWMNGEERERNRISNELHDGVAAMLGAAKLHLESIPFLPEDKQRTQLDKATSILERTHADVRRIAHNLLPVTLEQHGLVAAIRQFAGDINQTGLLAIEVTAQTEGMPPLSRQTELMLFRIVQELINNVMKHADATKAIIGLAYDATHFQVEVQDNGKGFASADASNNQGLYSIRERVKALDGSFDLKSENGLGANAVLRVSLPART